MEKHLFFLFAVVAATLLPGPAFANGPVLDALVKFKEQRELPAQEPGVLMQLAVKEGDVVRKGQLLAQVDDSEPKMQKKVANYSLSAAYKRWKDDVEIRFSKAQAAVAEKDYEKLVETNRIAPKTVTDVDMRRAKLDWDRSVLAIEKATHEQELAKFEAYTKQAELEASDLAIKRRVIVAPFDGEIVKLYRQQDEWVNPGDPLLRIVQRDTMHVEGAAEQSEFNPYELKGCDVTVDVLMAHGRTATVPGRVVYVSPEVRLDGKFVVRAELANPLEEVGAAADKTWLLSDGQSAKMTIHVNSAGAPAAEVSRRP